MKRFQVIITGVCPSSWDIATVRNHLRKTFTQSEVDSALIEEIYDSESQSTNVVRSEPFLAEDPQKAKPL